MADDFYIGYDTPVPAGSRRLVFGTIGGALVLAVGLAVGIVAAQQRFPAASFAFGERHPVTGVVRIDPYPALETAGGRILLVAPGKHGAEELMRPFADRWVRLEGAPIERDGRRMIEVAPGTVTPASAALTAEATTPVDLGDATLSGEIVDGKCYLGVMNPGEGTVHRDCATACLRGGLPPLFAARDAAGTRTVYELTSADVHGLSAAAASLAGRAVTVHGRVLRRPDGQRVIRTVASSITVR